MVTIEERLKKLEAEMERMPFWYRVRVDEFRELIAILKEVNSELKNRK